MYSTTIGALMLNNRFQPGLFSPAEFNVHIRSKNIDKTVFYDKITTICKGNAETRSVLVQHSERGTVKALVCESVSHFQAARDDRDGRSRYRAAKISR